MRYFLLIILFCEFSYAQTDSIVHFGQQLIYENKHTEAINYFNKQLLQPKNSVQEVELLLGLAEVYKLGLDFNTANAYYLKAFKAIQKTNNYQLEFLYYVKMAEFYRKRTLYLETITQLAKAKEISKKHVITDANLAKYYSRKAALFTEYFSIDDSTLTYAKKSLFYAEKINDKNNIFYARLEIAGVYDRQKDFSNAIISFENLIKYARENRLVQNEADVYINYITVLIRDGQIDKALREALKAMDFAKENNLLYNENIYAIKIYEIYKSQRQFEKANEYLELRQDLSEKYYSFEHNKFLFELEEKYKLSDRENQITINNLALANKSKELGTNRIRLYVILGLFLCAIFISLLIAYFLRKSKITNKELQFLSKQNGFLLSEANHRINNNLQLIIILITVQLNKIPDSEGEEMKKILKKINSIATLHRHLYQSNDKRHVNSYKYLKDIQIGFRDLFEENNIEANFEIDAIELTADVSMYLGLLLTELCINSIKYAFVNQEHKKIDFKLKQENDSFYFNYSDNGIGVASESAKPKLIDQLCRQLQVPYTIDSEKGYALSFQKNIKW